MDGVDTRLQERVTRATTKAVATNRQRTSQLMPSLPPLPRIPAPLVPTGVRPRRLWLCEFVRALAQQRRVDVEHREERREVKRPLLHGGAGGSGSGKERKAKARKEGDNERANEREPSRQVVRVSCPCRFGVRVFGVFVPLLCV